MLCRTAPLCLALVASGSAAQEWPSDGSEALEARIAATAAEFAEDEDLASLALLVSVGDDVLFEGGWGTASDGSRVTADSTYPATSFLEPFAVVAALQLVATGDLRLDTPLKEHFPGLEQVAGDVTLAHLLAQTSGLPPLDEIPGGDMTFEDLLTALAEAPLVSEPGECFAYSDVNHLLSGQIVARVTGAPLWQSLAEGQLEPAGMRSTTRFEGSEEASPVVVAVAGEVRASAAGALGAWGLQSTVRDLWRWHRALVERELLADREYERVTTPWELEDGTVSNCGLGTTRTSISGYEGFVYGGGVGDVHARVTHYAALDLTIALILEGDEEAPDHLARAVARAAFDLPQPGVLDRPLTPELAELYRGTYQMGCNRIQIERDGERLNYVAVEREFGLLYQGARHTFRAAHDADVRIVFEVHAGSVVGFVLEEAGLRTAAVRVQRGSSD